MNTFDTTSNNTSSTTSDNTSDITKTDVTTNLKDTKTFIDKMKNRYIYSFLLHALGDVIGFKNSDWKLDYGKPADIGTINEFVYEFIDLGGVNGIDLSKWIESSDTIYNIAIGNAILKHKGKVDKNFIIHTKNFFILGYNRMMLEQKDRIFRYPGATTEKIIRIFSETVDARTTPYNPKSGGNGVAARSIPIGIAFYKESDLDILIETAITIGMLTHNSPLGYLAGLSVAYFASLAIRDVPINLWPHMMIDLLESERVSKFIDTKNSQINFDYMDYIRYWKKYVDTRFTDHKPIKSRSTSNLIFRTKYYYENFVKETKSKGIGVSGFCAVIMAYDALLDCDGKWEKVIFYAMLNPSDSGTVGAICGGLYGTIYGMGDVPEHMLNGLEDIEVLTKLGKTYWKKFYKTSE